MIKFLFVISIVNAIFAIYLYVKVSLLWKAVFPALEVLQYHLVNHDDSGLIELAKNASQQDKED